MHLRQARYRSKRRVLRYLHSMYAHANRQEIEGMISGPSVFWHYRLNAPKGRTQLQVLAQRSPPQDAARLQATFLAEILERIRQERSGQLHFPKLLAGQFYLRRSAPGMTASHQNCQAAIASGALDSRFVAQLGAWNLELLHP
jgi:hypothetical protein